MMESGDCPSLGELTAFHRGEIGEGQLDRIAAHIEGCPRCDAALKWLESEENTISQALRNVAAGPTLGPGGTEAPPVATDLDDPGPPAGGPEVPSEVGTVIGGRYKLLERIGEGGMGTVWMAQQAAPVRRLVAIKLVKRGMDTRQVLARFEAERQALAMMDHPNIARVLEAGATETGSPYFVMELVKGVTITRYCDEQNMATRERLGLFIDVCRALQHAHQKGVIHRDVKPSNVLVALYDGRPVPKVIDFGIAKAVGEPLTDRTLATGFGVVVGTPEYMSPEQAELNQLDVDTRSDVYALGVLLYELLTGSTPIDPGYLRRGAILEVLRMVREVEPDRPSSRISSSEGLPSLAARRNIEPRRLAALVRGDLDWITMRALEKDRSRRYETANALARDLERFLSDEPVDARPPSATYRLGKFARKHRAALATIGAFAMILVAATVVSVGLAMRARRAETLAVARQARASDRERMAIEAVRRYGDVVRDTPELKNNAALARLRATLLKEPQAFFDRLRDRLRAEPETTPESLARLGAATFDLGQLTAEIGDKQDALSALEESAAIRERLVLENPSVAGYQEDLGLVRNNLGNLLAEIGKPSEAMAAYRRALEVRERLAREQPSGTIFERDMVGTLNNIALLQGEAGHAAEALASYERAREISERLARANPSKPEFEDQLGVTYVNLARHLCRTDAWAEGMDLYKLAVAIFERLSGQHPDVTRHAMVLALLHTNIGNELAGVGKSEEAMASYRRSLQIRERLAIENPSATPILASLAGTHLNVGNFHRAAGRKDEAMAVYRSAFGILERLSRENPTDREIQDSLAKLQNNMGTLLLELGKADEAMALHGRTLEIRERLAREYPEIVSYRHLLAGIHYDIGRLHRAENRWGEAGASFRRAAAIYEKLARDHPAIDDYRHLQGSSYLDLGNSQGRMGQLADAMATYRRALAILEPFARSHPDSAEAAREVGGIWHNMATVDLMQEQRDKARVELKTAIEWQRRAFALRPSDAGYRRTLVAFEGALLRACQALGLAGEAEEARHDLDELAATDPATRALDARLAGVLKGGAPTDDAERLRLAHHAVEKSFPAASARLFAQALSHDPKLGDDRRLQHRYNAACAAVLAAGGLGKDEPRPDPPQRSGFLRWAREWLDAELAAWSEVLKAGPPGSKSLAVATLKHWKSDADLAGVREEKELAGLPDAERAEFRRIWREVDRLLELAGRPG